MKVLMISGSRNPKGRTAQAADAMLEGAVSAGADAERVFLPPLTIERCRQCEDDGWGICREEGQCIIDYDDFAAVVDKIREADAVILATPVYFHDQSESMRALLDRLRRICVHEAGDVGIDSKPAIGLCVAGGGGGGGPECCVSLERAMGWCGFDVIDLIPVRRQNLEGKRDRLQQAGKWLASGARSE